MRTHNSMRSEAEVVHLRHRQPSLDPWRACLFASDDVLRVQLPEEERRPVVQLCGFSWRHLLAIQRRAVCL